ncbi:MAG TPA: flagellar biosynthesis protein FlhB [Firmicutes bacterium]|nr:flagellar biosynthesis protein FlhB [Bacillota bacterium]
MLYKMYCRTGSGFGQMGKERTFSKEYFLAIDIPGDLKNSDIWQVTNLTMLLHIDLQFFAQDPDKTEEATPRRKSEARKKGQVAKSTELNSVIALLALIVILNYFGGWFYNELLVYLQNNLGPDALTKQLTEANLSSILFRHCLFFLRIFLPLGLGAALVGIIVNVLQVGPLFTLEPLKPKFSRLNPISGFQRMFSSQGLVELVKSILKLVIVIYFLYSTIKDRINFLIEAVKLPAFDVAKIIWTILYQVSLKICIFLFVLALMDYLYQRWQYNKSLRMTKKEIRDEYKQTEGNPLIKNKIRQRQHQIAARRMMQEVPKADVVITNPTHLAIALRYDPATMAAPMIVAKGEGFIAEKIKEVAISNGVALVENRPLAQSLFKTVDIGEAVPDKLYQAVAEVLAFVYRLKRKRA